MITCWGAWNNIQEFDKTVQLNHAYPPLLPPFPPDLAPIDTWVPASLTKFTDLSLSPWSPRPSLGAELALSRLGAVIPLPENSPGGNIWVWYSWACSPLSHVFRCESYIWWAMREPSFTLGRCLAARCCHWNRKICRSHVLWSQRPARTSGEWPKLSGSSMVAPLWSRTSTALFLPCAAAMWRAVRPLGVLSCTSAPD